MGWVSSVVADVVWSLGQKAVTYTRKRTEREHLLELARWDMRHVGITPKHDSCVVCGLKGVRTSEQCPGPKSSQEARKRLMLLEGLERGPVGS